MLEPQDRRATRTSPAAATRSNCNHPVVRDLILDCLRYWVHRDARGRLPLRPRLDPRPRARRRGARRTRRCSRRSPPTRCWPTTKLIAEAWDAAGLYQVGSFPSWGRWAEWNGRFRDDVRRFVKGDPGHDAAARDAALGQLRPVPRLRARALALDQLRHQPRRLHAGRPRRLRRQAQRGERRGQRRRPAATTHSWNCGVEGPTTDPAVRRAARAPGAELRDAAAPVAGRADAARRATRSAARSAATTTPTARTTRSPGSTGRSLETNAELVRFVAAADPLPQGPPVAAPAHLLRGRGEPAVAWHGARLGRPDWDGSRARWDAVLTGADEAIYLASRTPTGRRSRFELPKLPAGKTLAPLRRHGLDAGRGRARAGRRGVARVGAQLRARPALGRGAGRPLGAAAGARAALSRELAQHVPDVRVRLRDAVERGPVELEQLAARERDDARRARLAREDRHLAEEGALLQVADRVLLAARRPS